MEGTPNECNCSPTKVNTECMARVPIFIPQNDRLTTIASLPAYKMPMSIYTLKES